MNFWKGIVWAVGLTAAATALDLAAECVKAYNDRPKHYFFAVMDGKPVFVYGNMQPLKMKAGVTDAKNPVK
jgi:hypothetical protein